VIFNTGKQYVKESKLVIQEQFVANLPVLGNIYKQGAVIRVPTTFVFPIGAITDETVFSGLLQDGTKNYTTPLATDTEHDEAMVTFFEFEDAATHTRWLNGGQKLRNSMLVNGRGVINTRIPASEWLKWSLGAKYKKVEQPKAESLLGPEDAKGMLKTKAAQGAIPPVRDDGKEEAVDFAHPPKPKAATA